MTWVALLRGINVGRNKRLAMSDLRTLLESLGHGDVRTHLKSGNAIFTTGTARAADLEGQMAARIQKDLGLSVKVLCRAAADIAAIVDANPFVARGVDAAQLHVAFLSATPSPKIVRAIDPDTYAPDEFVFGDRAIYVRLTDGVMGSRLPSWERLLGLDVTMRNWNTVSSLRRLAG